MSQVLVSEGIHPVWIDTIIHEGCYAFGHMTHPPRTTVWVPFWKGRQVKVTNNVASFSKTEKKYRLRVGGIIMAELVEGPEPRCNAIAWAPEVEFKLRMKPIPQEENTAPAEPDRPTRLITPIFTRKNRQAIHIEFDAKDMRMFRFWNGEPLMRGRRQVHIGQLGKIPKNPKLMELLIQPNIVVECEISRGLWKECVRNPLLSAIPTSKPQLSTIEA